MNENYKDLFVNKPSGIIIFGLNGSGKTALGKELAKFTGFKHMDIEDYYFKKTKIPYTEKNSKNEFHKSMLDDIYKYKSFIISAVTGDFGDDITSMYKLAIYLTAPIDTRVERVRQRTYEQYGERVCEGGDMYEQNSKFIDFVASRSLYEIGSWSNTLTCPIFRLDGTKAISENIHLITEQYF